jgi:hypothetical protein
VGRLSEETKSTSEEEAKAKEELDALRKAARIFGGWEPVEVIEAEETQNMPQE